MIWDYQYAWEGLAAVLLALVGGVWLIGQALRKERPSNILLLLLLTGAGAWLRWHFSQFCILESWDYNRAFRMEYILEALSKTGILKPLGVQPYWDVAFAVNGLFAILTITAVYAHVKVWLERSEPALLAAAILAFLPVHIKFSFSNVQFIPTIFWNTICLIALHEMVKGRTSFARVAASIVFLDCFFVNFFVRFLNCMYFPYYAIFFAVLYHRQVRENRWFFTKVGAAYGLMGGFLMLEYLKEYHVKEVIGGRASGFGLFSLFSPQVNSFLDPWGSPPLLVLLALWGGYALWKRPEGRKYVWLLGGWFVLFFFTHLVVVMNPMNQARFSLHMMPPVVILAACGWSALPWKRRIWHIVAVLMALSPWFHQGFLGDYDYNRQREFTMLREAMRLIPDGALVLEPEEMLPTYSEVRMRTFNKVFDFPQGIMRERFASLPFQSLAELPEFQEAYYLQDTRCFTWDPAPDGLNPLCRSMREKFDMEPLRETSFKSRVYNPQFYRGITFEQNERLVVTVGLYRVTPKVSPAPPPLP